MVDCEVNEWECKTGRRLKMTNDQIRMTNEMHERTTTVPTFVIRASSFSHYPYQLSNFRPISSMR